MTRGGDETAKALDLPRRYANISLMIEGQPAVKPVAWVGPSRNAVREFPEEVRDEIWFALYQAQRGFKHPSAKPLRGFGGAGVLEIIANHEGDTFRAVYTVRFRSAVYTCCTPFRRRRRRGSRRRDITLI